MNARTYQQLWSLYKKGMAVEAVVEALQSITVNREEATPWLVKFVKDYADERVEDNLQKRGLFKVESSGPDS